MDQRLVVVSRLFYERQLSKTDIAKKLDISITHVGRLLKEAGKRGIVKVIIESPRYEGLEIELKETFGLRDASVVLAPHDERSLHIELGSAAARFFERNVANRESVGLGSGRTLFEMVNALEEKEREISIYPLSGCAEQDLRVTSIDANTLVKILWFKSGPDVATATRLELLFPDDTILTLGAKVQGLLQKTAVKKLIDDISDLDNYFFSCSYSRERSQLTKLLKIFGDKPKTETGRPAIGDVVFNMIDELGGLVPTQIDDLLFRVSLETLRNVSSNRRKRVVLASGGTSKAKVIQAGLKAGLFNTLITDNLTAEQLLRAEA